MSRFAPSSSRSSVVILRRSTPALSSAGTAPATTWPRNRGWWSSPATSPATACWLSCQNRKGVSASSLAASSRVALPSHVRRITVAAWCAFAWDSGLADAHSARTGGGIFVGTANFVRLSPLRTRRDRPVGAAPGGGGAVGIGIVAGAVGTGPLLLLRPLIAHLLATRDGPEVLGLDLLALSVRRLDHQPPLLAVQAHRLPVDLPHEIDRLPRRLAQGQPELVLGDLRLDRRPHLARHPEEPVRGHEPVERLVRALVVVKVPETLLINVMATGSYGSSTAITRCSGSRSR